MKLGYKKILRMYVRVLIKTVEVAIWPEKFVRDPHKVPIRLSSILATCVVTSILVKDALTRVLTVAVDFKGGSRKDKFVSGK